MTADDLAGLPLLCSLDAAGRKRLAQIARWLDFAPRGRLFREGDESSGLIWVIEGRVRCWSARDAPVELGRGALFGAIALVSAGKRRFSADAVTPTRALELRRTDFQEFGKREPAAALALLRAILADQAALFEEALDELGSGSGS